MIAILKLSDYGHRLSGIGQVKIPVVGILLTQLSEPVMRVIQMIKA